MLLRFSPSKTGLSIFMGFVLLFVASTALAIPFTTNVRSQLLTEFSTSSEKSLSDVLRTKTDYVGSGPSGSYTQADQTTAALFTPVGESVDTTLVIELAGFHRDNEFGLYNLDGTEITLFDGGATAGASLEISFVGDTLKIGAEEHAGFGTTFGLFLHNDDKEFTWYSQDILNRRGRPHFLGFEQGDALYFGFEDLNLGDRDYNDFVGKLSGIRPDNPVPEPAAALAFCLGALLMRYQLRRTQG